MRKFFRLVLKHVTDEIEQQRVLAIAEAAIEKAGGAQPVLGQTFKRFWEKTKLKFEKKERSNMEADEAWLYEEE